MLGTDKSCGLVPRVAVYVSYHPDIIHFISGCRSLLVVVAVGYETDGAVGCLENIVAVEAGAEALRLVELIVINLRLRVVVRRIT